MDDAFAAGDQFLLSEGRLLERRLFATSFLGAPASGVVDALRGYQNEDGGFGQALEPDTRCPASLPVYVETAFHALAAAGTTDQAMVRNACEFLSASAAEAGAGGAVAPASPVIESFPRAAHWTEWTYVPGLNPTAGLVGLLYQLDFEHPWREQAAGYCWAQLESAAVPEAVHTVLEALVFLEHVPERERADDCAMKIAAHFGEIEGLHLDPKTPGYGLSPLHFAAGTHLPLAQVVHRFPDRGCPRSPPRVPGGRRRVADNLGAAERGGKARVARHRHPASSPDPRLLRPPCAGILKTA